MLKYCKEQWSNNEGKLRNALMNDKKLDCCDYKHLLKLVVDNILNDEDRNIEYDSSKITVIDDGDYQGTELYLIPLKTYQPAEYDYLMTYTGYGSCSGCDTLQSIQYSKPDDKKIDEYVKLCRDLVCNIIKPYNTGWRNEELYEVVETCI